MFPTIRCYLLLLIGFVIAGLLGAFGNNSLSILVTLIYDIIVMTLTVWDGIRVNNNKVTIQRQPLARLSVGRDNSVTLEVKSQNSAIIQVKDEYPLLFDVSSDLLEAEISANSSSELSYTVHPTSRGEYQWGNIAIRQLGNWGLAWRSWKVEAKQKVSVYPDLIGLRSLSIRLTLGSTGAMRQARKLGNGTEFAELKQYSQGDDVRLIDWKATARRNRPLLRALEPEQEQTLFILLDRGRLMTAQVQGLKRFDWGLNITLSLALAALNRGDKVGVAVFDRDITTWIPPERGQFHLSKLIENLTPIQPVLLESDYLGSITKVITQQTRRALVVVITDLIDITASTELLSAMARLTPRYLPFCVTLRDSLVDTIAHNMTHNLRDTYKRAVALDLLSQREVALLGLKQKGVLVLDAPCNQISDRLIERYLQLKAKNLL
ncbi:conserved hypothetical protein [Hyella patelloides LEGE 07179]|uniref:DUF58 domain-containing protein n=1 Tax=Hyella patelloides LEGE 07179 TaxID=945734 RepID=A0A563W352_9CYAN|nr:DUF58 domain-containing protein [Hyella patelloides]VEP18118.1 conserved hypothetical protein [Hyella patelloides LEGE 07179]